LVSFGFLPSWLATDYARTIDAGGIGGQL